MVDERPWNGDPPPASWYRFSPDWKGQHPKDHLACYQGWMHAHSVGQNWESVGKRPGLGQVGHLSNYFEDLCKTD